MVWARGSILAMAVRSSSLKALNVVVMMFSVAARIVKSYSDPSSEKVIFCSSILLAVTIRFSQ